MADEEKKEDLHASQRTKQSDDLKAAMMSVIPFGRSRVFVATRCYVGGCQEVHLTPIMAGVDLTEQLRQAKKLQDRAMISQGWNTDGTFWRCPLHSVGG